MLLTLPDAVVPFRLARQGVRLQGWCDVTKMHRLALSAQTVCHHQHLANEDHQINIDWSFSLYQQRYPRLTGQLTAQITVLCCRCLSPFLFDLQAETDLLLVNSADEIELADDVLLSHSEFYAMDGQTLSLATVLEDELLLALPLMPCHTVCPDNQYIDQHKPTDVTENLKTSDNPFQVLAHQKV
jgi:uncharacterized protein